jgi:tRNA U34 5-carboxymethylaminomethyl modifying enzyme MnmG/GidA
VQGPRVQADRELYRKNMQVTLGSMAKLDIAEGAVGDLILNTDHSHSHPSVDGIVMGRSMLAAIFSRYDF